MPSRFRRRRVKIAPRVEPGPVIIETPKPDVSFYEPPSEPKTEADYEKEWKSKFRVRPITYNAQDGSPRDVRTFIFDRSYILSEVVKRYRLRRATHDETMYRCCLFVQDYIRYVSDSKSRSQNEYWQNPEDTINRGTGDCEDGAILMKSLALIAGVPDWKCKIVAGMVRGGGHAYCTYLSKDKQLIMDWCYWPTRASMNSRKSLGEDERYGDVWFSFTHDYSYSGKSLAYKNGSVREGYAKPTLNVVFTPEFDLV